MIKSLSFTSAILVSSLMLSACGFIGNIFNRGEEVKVEPETVATVNIDGGELVERITLSEQATADLNTNYANDPANKAFAVSPSGAFGVAFGAATMREAKQAALEKCMQDVVPGDLECIVYNVNGIKTFRPTNLRRVR